MATDPLPWSELLRRRNGLPPALHAELADATAQQPDHIRYALAGLGITAQQPVAGEGETAGERMQRLIAEAGLALPEPPQPEAERDPDLSLLTISPALLRAYLDSAQPPEPRCPLTELPTTMCHHCQETSSA